MRLKGCRRVCGGLRNGEEKTRWDVSGVEEGEGGRGEGEDQAQPTYVFPFGVHVKEGYHVGVFWLIRLHHISLIPYRDEQKRNRGTNAENGKDEWPSLHHLPPFLLCK